MSHQHDVSVWGPYWHENKDGALKFELFKALGKWYCPSGQAQWPQIPSKVIFFLQYLST